MNRLTGPISDRIRSGTLPADVAISPVRPKEIPSPRCVRCGEGHGLGNGATRRRNGGADESPS